MVSSSGEAPLPAPIKLSLTVVVHGAGEELRGSVNSFFDGMGSETTKGARDHPSSSVADQDVYNKGKAEFDSGMSNLQSHHHHHGAAVGAAPSAGSQAATGTVTSTPATAGAVPPKAATSTTGAPTPPHAAATQ